MFGKKTFRHIRKTPLFFILFLLFSSPLFADYPRILNLSESDLLFSQLENGISEFYKATALHKPLPALQVFVYRTKIPQSVFALSARCNLTYETLATINRIHNTNEIEKDTDILIPNMPGVFIPFSPGTEFEELLRSSKSRDVSESITVTLNVGGKRAGFHFIPGERFNTEELSFFLGVLFRFPLETRKAHISSYFGQRKNPFGTSIQFHHGLDIAAPIDTPVLASRAGVVAKTGFDSVFGNYILLRHDDGYQTFYGHLDAISVQLNEKVKSGTIIGKLGSTGFSTGPHLHFEIRKDRKPIDPTPLLPRDYR